MRQLSSLTFLMLSEFSEIVKIIFLPANSLWSRPPKKHHSVAFSLCFWIPVNVGFVVVLFLFSHFISFQPVSHRPYPDAFMSFLSHNPLGRGILQCPI